MITELTYKDYCLQCDKCGYRIAGFDDFEDATNYKDEHKWIGTDRENKWKTFCPDCQ